MGESELDGFAAKCPVGTKFTIDNPEAPWWVRAALWKVSEVDSDGIPTMLAHADIERARAIEEAMREGRTLEPYGA